MSETFDRDWPLAELLDGARLAQAGGALAGLLGGDLAICDRAGHVLWGLLPPAARREPLIVELEPIGWLCGAGEAAALRNAAALLTQLLRTQLRFKMASSLHVQAMSEDFETLRLEHARLLDSEARYKALAEQLEKRVQAQVAQLEERQQMLYEAEKLASVGQLAAGVAHEVNNPLGFVRSNLSTFGHYLDVVAGLKGRLPEAAWAELDLDFIIDDGQDLLQECIKGLDRIARIVAELKSFSNVDRASEEYTDINECLRHAAGVIDGQLPPGVSLRLELLPLPPMVCLPGHLNQMFMNLLRNAVQAIVDAGRPGSIVVASEADEAGIRVRIHDDGVGMSDEQKSRAFEPFYTTRPVGAGAGLGLSSARNIVLAHSGRIELSSTANTGTTVSVFFPVAS
ncbi:MAG: two-component sensor histidine kinase [Betaproteobacteria bacterium HGW-Betaproteobacteria-12]|nr:MAG: two-component sensor histidine kinase [Betaproteobacteria bacterium HGW-Betaproteobacteria-12]